MDASSKIQRSIHDVRLTYKYVSRILGTYQRLELQRIFCKISYNTTLSSADNTAAPYTASSYLPCSSLSLIPAAHSLYMV